MNTAFIEMAAAELQAAKAHVAALESLLAHTTASRGAPAPRARKPGVAKASAETITGPTGQKLVRKPRKAAGAPRGVRQPRPGSVPAKILETLSKNENPVGASELANLLETSAAGVQSALQQLQKRGFVTKHGERGSMTYSAVHLNGASA